MRVSPSFAQNYDDFGESGTRAPSVVRMPRSVRAMTMRRAWRSVAPTAAAASARRNTRYSGEWLDRELFWTTSDLEKKLLDLQHHNEHRTHTGRNGHPPVTADPIIPYEWAGTGNDSVLLCSSLPEKGTSLSRIRPSWNPFSSMIDSPQVKELGHCAAEHRFDLRLT